MRSIHFDVQGFNRTYWDFFVAAGFSVGVLYLFAAILAWQLGESSGRDAGAHARHGVVVRPFLCRHHGCKLEAPLCHTHRVLDRDYSLSHRGGMDVSEAGCFLTPGDGV